MTSSLSASVDWPQALIFDLDGTLIDSAPDIARAVNATLADRDIAIDAAEARRHVGDGARQLLARVLGAHAAVVDPAALDELTTVFNRHYHDTPCVDTCCYPGVLDMLSAEKAAGRRLAVCTNKPQAVAERVLSSLGLAASLDVLIGAGAYALKPDPEPLLACVEQIGIDAWDAVYVGDMAVDRQAARAAGLPVVLCRFGYSAEDVEVFAPDAILDDWAGWSTLRDGLAAARTGAQGHA